MMPHCSCQTGLMSGAARHSLKLLKLFRIAKLFRLRRVSQLFNLVGAFSVHLEETLNFHVTADIVKVAQILFLALVMAHWIGCFQFMLVRSNDFPPDSWVVFSDLQDAIPVVQWSWSVYKALAQMILIGFQTPPYVMPALHVLYCRDHWLTIPLLSFVHSIASQTPRAKRTHDGAKSNIGSLLAAFTLEPFSTPILSPLCSPSSRAATTLERSSKTS